MAVNGWFIFFGLLWAYILFLLWLAKSGRMQKWNLSLLLGLVLMIRTKRGRKTLDVLAKPKKFWNALGDFGTGLSLVGMVGMTAVMLFSLVFTIQRGDEIPPLRGNEILIIPGVTPFLPLWYGIAALIVTLVVHEGGHGVLARANGLKVKSLGLLYAIVPIGAFVEPDEDELNEAPRRHRLRVFAAGATINILLAAVLLFAFAGMVGATEPVDGIPIIGVSDDSAAELAGIRTGDVIVGLDGMPALDNAAFTALMADKAPGQQVEVQMRGGSVRTATLDDRWSGALDEEAQNKILSLPDQASWTEEHAGIIAYCDNFVGAGNYSDGGTCSDGLQRLAFLGVVHYPIQQIYDTLTQPMGNSGLNLLTYISLPIGEVRDNPVLSFYLPTFFEEPFQGFWIIATLTFWIFWINLMVGLTNILPMLPLDGGHIFRDAAGGVVARFKPKMERESRDRFVGRLAGGMSFLILGTFLATIFLPRFM